MIVSCAGDVGDSIFLAGVLHSVPNGPHQMLFVPSHLTKYKTVEECKKLEALVAPLMSKQPYISECRLAEPIEHIDWKSQDFRGRGRWCPEVSLLGAKSYHLHMVKGFGQNITGKERWLHNVPSSSESKDRVVINRTGRYRNPYFPWREIVNFYGDRLLFIGLPHEYRDFCGEWGMVEYARTNNLLEAAELIEGSLLFIGNQSSANAVCEGLKHNLIQETDLGIPDCIFRRNNAQHVVDGLCFLPGFDEPDRQLPCKVKPVVSTAVVPPNGGWEYPGLLPDKILGNLIEKVVKAENIDKNQAKDKIIEFTVSRKPYFFQGRISEGCLAVAKMALSNAV